MASQQDNGVYYYRPSHALPAVFAILAGLSLTLHTYQNFHYRFWRVTYFMVWGGVVFTAGWILRCIASYNTGSVNLYIAQTVMIYAGPPIFAAAEYNILGRLMYYLPMYAPLNPGLTVYFFIYLGAAVEGLTAAGAALYATAAQSDDQGRSTGGTLISVALVIQAVVECVFMSLVGLVHMRCARNCNVPAKVRNLCVMLYGTSSLVLVRCIARAIEDFATLPSSSCGDLCQTLRYQEWYLYVFEAAPMILYTWWLNAMHPGRLLPRWKEEYLDLDGKTERLGPGWIDRRSKAAIFADPLDVRGLLAGKQEHDPFWLSPDRWPTTSAGHSEEAFTHSKGGSES
ncbi:hypothetical protein D0864_04360 [Hortaea werneckii]|uniref:RTA1 domain protein n=1 Tax=Hortaea werneckii TaxID=91943 RepID=A0A3M7GBR5_HORWE|nr:hypothetical protein D0864_04360 [Hortaea werneckii]